MKNLFKYASKAKLFGTLTALWLVMKDRRTPLIAKIIGGLVLAYALSPIDLIPDFIPVIGLLDDLILIPLGVALAIKFVPAAQWQEAQDVGYRAGAGFVALDADRRGLVAGIFGAVYLMAINNS
jgi:uncharacterized membrane protein YkvA (DUF1232 family)